MTRSVALVAALAGLALLAAASGSPPAVQVSGPSPFARCTEDNAALQPGFFTPGSEVEPKLAVNPRNPRNLVGTYQQDRWSDGGARGLVAATSFDGGLIWATTPIPGLSRCSGGSYDRATDPWLSFAPNGDVYHVALALDGHVIRQPQLREPPTGRERRSPEGGGYRATALLVSKSQSGGLTWGTPSVVAQDSGDGFHDKETILADPADPSRAYLVWDYYHGRGELATNDVSFSRTSDGGRTWERARAIYSPPDPDHVGAYPQLVAQPDGTLLAFFTYWMPTQRDAQGKATAWLGLIGLKRSRDGGRSWQPQGEPQGGPSPLTARRITTLRGVSLRTGSGIPDVASDPSTGRLYVVWEEALGPARAAAFSMSHDGGATWSPPIRVSQNPRTYTGDGNDAWHSFTPTVAVGRGGTVAVSYYDLRHSRASSAQLATAAFVSICRPAFPSDCASPTNWHEEPLTEDSFDLLQAPYAYGFFLGDYQGLTSDGIDFLAFFSRVHAGDRASVFFRRILF